ncbi:MAG: methylenetetrahydrofolate reductase [NAD(P)H] [Alphaproteobacteria bacterium]|nr:methylenetetrahydrofolate reductase [NAD(P)H] [Alphaproteobacteria bacterium]
MIEDSADHYAERRVAWLGERLPTPCISFEFFPPKTEEGEAKFWRTVERLAELKPSYVSVTCGAGGNPAEGTAPLVKRLREDAGIETAAHLTCASAPKTAVETIARRYWQDGVKRIVALRGDRPKAGCQPAQEYHSYAADLVESLRKIGNFDIAVAGYPEFHPEAESPEADLDNLKRKVEAGANRVITQYCFDTDAVLRFRDALVGRCIDVPLAVGLLPVHNFTQAKRFSERCGADVPAWLGTLYEGLEDEPAQRALIAASVAAEQARRLVVEGVEQLHFYTLNRADLTIATCRLLGMRPTIAKAA